MSELPPGTRVQALLSDKTGHAVQCIGLARALHENPDLRPVRPGALFRLLAPWGPADPAFFSRSEPVADIVIASGKETVPVLRRIKHNNPRTFAVYLGDPRVSRRVFDLIWAPLHDRIAGENVFKTATAPHPHDRAALDAERASPDARIGGLAAPSVAVLIGGASGQYAFGAKDIEAVRAAVDALLGQGASVMISPSRRTPQALVQSLLELAARMNAPQRVFVWTGEGENPYRSMLALADAFLVTADSTNMIGEAAATGKPVHVLALEGDTGKFARFYEALEQRDATRIWDGRLQTWSYDPIDGSAEIAAETVRRYMAVRAARR